MWITRIVLFILIGLLSTDNSHCQSHYGTEFIFGIPYNIACTGVFISIASENLGTYYLRIPFLNVNETGYIGNITEIRVNCSIAKFKSFKENQGIYLHTSVEVSVYATNYYTASAESFLVLPLSELGQNYAVSAYEPYTTAKIIIMIVATINTTNGYIYDGKLFHNFSLNVLDVFHFTTASDIQRMSVTSDKPVTVILGTSCANIPPGVSACDLIMEQMIPFQSLDNIYIVPPTPPKKAYELKVTHFNNSKVDTVCFHNISNSKSICTNNGIYFIRMGTEPTVICSNQTISVVQFGFGNHYPKFGVGDPFMTVIQGLKNFLNSYSFTLPRVYNNTESHASITIPTMDLNGLIMDGSNLTVPKKNIFSVSAPLQNYTVFVLDISAGYHHVYHVNRNVKFGLTIYGLGAAADKYLGFGYPAGMQLSMFVKYVRPLFTLQI